MDARILDRTSTTTALATYHPEIYDKYYLEDYDLYHSKKFADIMDEVNAEIEYMEAYPEECKFYTSTKEMFRDMGFDVSNMEDD